MRLDLPLLLLPRFSSKNLSAGKTGGIHPQTPLPMHTRHAHPVRPLAISLSRFSSSLALAAAMALAGSARATVLDWDPAGDFSNSGGTGAWNLTSPIWNNAGIDQIWNNGNLDIAQFGNTAGTVTLGTGITAGGLNFNVTGMTVTGNTLTLAGATTVNVTGGATATISSTLAGTSGAIIAGGGTLNLTQANTISGFVDIQAGTVRATTDDEGGSDAERQRNHKCGHALSLSRRIGRDAGFFRSMT